MRYLLISAILCITGCVDGKSLTSPPQGPGATADGVPETPAAPARLRLLWLSDSIYNTPSIPDAVALLMSGHEVVNDRVTYGSTTMGTALFELADETYAREGGSWVQKERGVPLGTYDGLVFEFGRNEGGGVDAARGAYDKILAQAHKGGIPRVVAGNCPPRASNDRVTWATVDIFNEQGYRAAFASAASKWSVQYTDTYSLALSLVPGKYAIADLMMDTVHLSTGVGKSVVAASILAALKDAGPPAVASPEIPGKVVNYLFGEPLSGVWATEEMPTDGPTRLLARVATLPDLASEAKGPGARLAFPPTSASQVWVHVLRGETGTIEAYVDRGTAQERKLRFDTNSGTPSRLFYPNARLVAGDLPAGIHSVEIQTTGTLPVRVVGVTYVGEP